MIGIIGMIVVLAFLIVFLWASRKFSRTMKKPMERYDHAQVVNKSYITSTKRDIVDDVSYYYSVDFQTEQGPIHLDVHEDVYNRLEIGQVGMLFKKEFIFIDFVEERKEAE